MIDTVQKLDECSSTCTKCLDDKLTGADGKRHIVLCGGTGCLSSNSKEIKEKFEKVLEEKGLSDKATVNIVGCFGFCSQGPFVKIYPEDTLYRMVSIDDVDEIVEKDIIGGVWVMPIKGLRIGAFGWTGTRGELATTYIDAKGVKQNVTIMSARKNRYALSAEYSTGEYMFRSEYLHSQGYGSNLDDGDKADGWYVFGIVPLIKGKLHGKARYQTYRVAKEWSSAKTSYECGLNYYFTKNLELHAEYARINDKSLATPKHSYNMVTCELDFRF